MKTVANKSFKNYKIDKLHYWSKMTLFAYVFGIMWAKSWFTNVLPTLPTFRITMISYCHFTLLVICVCIYFKNKRTYFRQRQIKLFKFASGYVTCLTLMWHWADVICSENVNIFYEGHLESRGNSEISQSQKQDPVYFSYQCKGRYSFFHMTILSTYFITFVHSDRPLLKYTVCIVKFSIFTTILNNFDIKKYLFYPNRLQETYMFCVTITTIKSTFQMYKRNLIRLISRKMTYVETLLYLKSGLFSLKML